MGLNLSVCREGFVIHRVEDSPCLVKGGGPAADQGSISRSPFVAHVFL